jgi:GNAT superfamily N-acetyltransferase
MSTNTPYAATDADQAAVADVLTEAFLDDPLARWLFPEAGERARLQPHFYRLQLAHPAAEAYLIGDHEGVSLWHNLTAGQAAHDEAPEPSASGPVFGENAVRLRALGAALAPRRPDIPHLYLSCMGVIGGRQGGGLGSAMLRHRLERADADGLGAYLEASSPRSRALYLRHGFEDLGEPVRVADSPPLWPMWRHPENQQDTGSEHR